METQERLLISKICGETKAKTTLAVVPMVEGTFVIPTTQGELIGEIHRPDSSQLRKVVLKGAIPTVTKRGNEEIRKNKKRRVVDLPHDITKSVRQSAGGEGFYEFKRDRLSVSDTVYLASAAD